MNFSVEEFKVGSAWFAFRSGWPRVMSRTKLSRFCSGSLLFLRVQRIHSQDQEILTNP